MNESAFDIRQVFGAYAGRLRAFLKARLADPADVDDVLQDVLLKAHQGLGALRQPERLTSWLFQVTRNAMIDHQRRRSTARPLDAEPAQPEVEADETDEIRRALAACVRPFVEALPSPYREALIAVDLEGRSQKALAAELGLSHSAVKSRVQRGRAMLRGVFDRCCSYDVDARGNVLAYHPKRNDCPASGCR